MIGSLCSGYGGLDIAVLSVLGGRLAWVADNDRHAAAILAARFPEAANLSDITTADWAKVPAIDVLTAGFPCQDISCAGKRTGLTGGTRSAIWIHVAEAVRVLRPRLVVVENVAALLTRGLDRVLADLAEAGYDALWRCVRASDIGAPHRRERLFLLAWPAGDPCPADLLRGPRRRGNQDHPADAHPDGRAEQFNGHPPGDQAGSRARNRPSGHRHPVQGHAGQPASRTASGDAQVPGHRTAVAAADSDRCPDLADTSGTHRLEAAQWQAAVVRLAGRRCPAPGTAPHRYPELTSEPVRPPRRPDADAGDRVPVRYEVDWGPYTPAIRRWEHVLGLNAPVPTEPARSDRPRLRASFVEWVMGLVPGYVTALDDIPRPAQLRALGNGVVPQQAAHALTLLLADLNVLTSTESTEAAA